MSSPLVMVANDDTVFIQLMQELLATEGYRTEICTSGPQAYHMIRGMQPDLVVLDIRTEHAESGWVVLDLVRLYPQTTHIPVIVCTADARFARERAEHLQAKRADVLDKPFDLDDLLARVSIVVGPAQADSLADDERAKGESAR